MRAGSTNAKRKSSGFPLNSPSPGEDAGEFQQA